jgi:hypothetical protein
MQGRTDSVHFGGDAPSRSLALAPILMGLAAPVLVLLLIDADALSSASLIIQLYLYAMFAVATGAYIVSIFETGDVTGVTMDGPARKFIVERTGLIAKSALEIPYADVAAVRIETRYDDDGYQTAMPVLVLTTREVVPLPAGTTESDVLTMRAMMKRG